MQQGAAITMEPVPQLRRKKGAQLSYFDVGAGEVLVLIHGVGLNAEAWKPQIEHFAASHRVIAVDMLGHGGSAMPEGKVSLASYAEAIVGLLDEIGVRQANVVGHSMGGLVALQFALSHPARCLRVAVLNSVYRRTPEASAAVLARAEEISRSGNTGNVEQPLNRWFGARETWPPEAHAVEAMLRSANPAGYAAAYKIFASSDEAFIGRLSGLAVPALFATGSLDHNSSPEMAKAMAEESPGATALSIDGARHMMNLTHPDEVNAALARLLSIPVAAIDTKDIRKAFGAFMTGVTVVTTTDKTGAVRGFTANSFTSVSLEPPLVLVCLNKTSASAEAFCTGKGFAVNVLAESQKDISNAFASRKPNRFENVDWTAGAAGNPVISGSVAWFDCLRHQVIEAGDHIVLIGRVQAYGHSDANPLGYSRGGYFSLGLEQTALSAAAQTGKIVVGAILEVGGKLLVTAGGPAVELPSVSSGGRGATSKMLLEFLASKGVAARLNFLFSVFEDPTSQTHYIFYRGEADPFAATGFATMDFTADVSSKFADPAVRIMIARYAEERLQGRYKIYSGDHIKGEVKSVS